MRLTPCCMNTKMHSWLRPTVVRVSQGRNEAMGRSYEGRAADLNTLFRSHDDATFRTHLTAGPDDLEGFLCGA